MSLPGGAEAPEAPKVSSQAKTEAAKIEHDVQTHSLKSLQADASLLDHGSAALFKQVREQLKYDSATKGLPDIQITDSRVDPTNMTNSTVRDTSITSTAANGAQIGADAGIYKVNGQSQNESASWTSPPPSATPGGSMGQLEQAAQGKTEAPPTPTGHLKYN